MKMYPHDMNAMMRNRYQILFGGIRQRASEGAGRGWSVLSVRVRAVCGLRTAALRRPWRRGGKEERVIAPSHYVRRMVRLGWSLPHRWGRATDRADRPTDHDQEPMGRKYKSMLIQTHRSKFLSKMYTMRILNIIIYVVLSPLARLKKRVNFSSTRKLFMKYSWALSQVIDHCLAAPRLAVGGCNIS